MVRSKVVETDAADISLEVEFNGTALSQSYSYFGVGSGTTYYTGASVEGTFLVETKNQPARTRKYIGRMAPPGRLPGGSGPRSAADAPFESVFLNESNFFSQIAEALREIFDAPAMTNFWLGQIKNIGRVKLAREKLAMLGPLAVNPIMNGLRSRSVNEEDGIAILSELSDPGALVSALTDTDIRVRRAVVTVLSRRNSDRYVGPLSQVLAGDKDAIIRAFAARSISGPNAAESLKKALGDTDPDVRLAVIESLGRSGDPMPLVQAAKEDKDPRVRAAAIQAFGRMTNAPIESLILALNDPDSTVKKAAAESMGGLSDKTAVGPLIAAMQGQPISTRRAIADTLKTLTGQDLGMDQQAWTKWWEGQPNN